MSRFGYSIFCDDIRNEAGGKLSFIGCYNGVIFISSLFPVVLPRLCVHVHVVSPGGQPFSSILIRCYVPGTDKPIAEESIAPPQQEEQIKLVADLGADAEAPRYIVAGASLIFAPMQLNGPGLIRVRAVIDGETNELPLGSLRVDSNV